MIRYGLDKEETVPAAPAGTVLFCCIRMDGAFADAEFLRGGADRGPVLYDVKSETLSPLLHIFFQTLHSPPLVAPSYAAKCRDMSG